MFLDPGVYGRFGTIVFGWFIFLPYAAEVKKNLWVHLYGEALVVQHHQRQVLLCLSSWDHRLANFYETARCLFGSLSSIIGPNLDALITGSRLFNSLPAGRTAGLKPFSSLQLGSNRTQPTGPPQAGHFCFTTFDQTEDAVACLSAATKNLTSEGRKD